MLLSILDSLVRLCALFIAACWICLSIFTTVVHRLLQLHRERIAQVSPFKGIPDAPPSLKHKKHVLLALDPAIFSLPPYLDIYRMEKPSLIRVPASHLNTSLFLPSSTYRHPASPPQKSNLTIPTNDNTSAPSMAISRQTTRLFDLRDDLPSSKFALPRNGITRALFSTVARSKHRRANKCKKRKSRSKLVNKPAGRLDRHAISHLIASAHGMHDDRDSMFLTSPSNCQSAPKYRPDDSNVARSPSVYS